MTRHSITLFRDIHHTRGGTPRTVTFGAFAAFLCEPRVYPGDDRPEAEKRPKPDDLGMVGLYESHNGDARSEAVIGASLVGVDFDTGASSPDSVIATLAGRVPYVLHSSWNDHPSLPRFRGVLPLSRVVTPAEWRDLYAGIADLFERHGHELDRACADPPRRFFLPAHRSGQRFYASANHTGRPIDADRLIEWAAARRAARVVPVATRTPRYESATMRQRRGRGWLYSSAVPTVLTAPHGTRNHVLCSYARTAGGYAACGYLDPSEAATALLDAIVANGGDERKDRDVIARSMAAGYAQPIEMPDRPRASAAERRGP